MGLYKKEKRETELGLHADLVIKEVQLIRKRQPKIGVRKLQVKLYSTMKRHGIKIGRDGLFDLLREFDMLVKQKRFKHYSTSSRHPFYKYPNLIKTLKWQSQGSYG